MSDFVDNHEQELTELFNEESNYAGDSDALATFLAHLNNIHFNDMAEADEVISDFDDSYEGTTGSEAEFAESFAKELGDLTAVPDYIKYHVDWEAVWDSTLRFDVDSYELPSGGFGFVRAN